eukprot:6202589-Pleurochrysis_carterae.AAC.1
MEKRSSIRPISCGCVVAACSNVYSVRFSNKREASLAKLCRLRSLRVICEGKLRVICEAAAVHADEGPDADAVAHADADADVDAGA